MSSDLVPSRTRYYDDWDHVQAAGKTWKSRDRDRLAASYDFENEFQFQLQGYARAGHTVNRNAHNRV